jgi:tetratricopeptide (TPR) repeat protein
LGQALRENCKFDEAVHEFETLVRLFPESRHATDALVMIGEYYFDEEPKKALAAFERAVNDKTSSRYTFALYSLAWCHHNVGEFGKGVAMMEAVVRHTGGASANSNFQDGDQKLRTEALRVLSHWRAKMGR